MQYPLEYNGITQGYVKNIHKGIDLGWNLLHGGPHAKIFSVDDGVVHRIDSQYTGGNVLIIRHDGFYSEYGHLSKIHVKVGDRITRGQHVANMGNTGHSNGKRVPYHLHFGLYKGDAFSYDVNHWVNPINYLELYPNQKFAPKTIEEYGKELKYYKEEPTKGIYKTLYNLNIRKSPNGEKVKVKNCTDSIKKALTSKNPNAYAVVKEGTKFTALDVVKDNGYWAKNYSGYICIENKKEYCKKV